MIALELMRPLGGHVVLKRMEARPNSVSPSAHFRDEGKVSSSLIISPDIAKPPSSRGKVISVGPGRINPHTLEREPMAVKPGDVVHFQSSDHELGEFIVIEEADILVVEDG